MDDTIQMTLTGTTLAQDAAEAARSHGLCTYSLTQLGWRYAGDVKAEEPFVHSNGQLGTDTGDSAGHLAAQPLIGRPALWWCYDEFGDEWGPFINPFDSDDDEAIIDALNSEDRPALDVFFSAVPDPTVCGAAAAVAVGTDRARCLVHATTDDLTEDSTVKECAQVARQIRRHHTIEATDLDD